MKNKENVTSRNHNSTLIVQTSALIAAYLESWLDYGFLGLRFSLQTELFSFKNFTINKTPQLVIESYRGITAFQASLVPSIIVQKTVESYSDVLFKRKGHTFRHDFLTSAFGGFLGSSIVTPVERIIIQQKKYQLGSIDTIKQITSRMGIMSLWVGFVATISREVPYAMGIWFFTPRTEQWLKSYTDKNIYILPAIVTGLWIGALTHPCDVIKTKIQYSETKKPLKAIINNIYKSKGLRGFFPGYIPRSISIIGSYIWLPYFFNLSKGRLEKPRNKEQKNSDADRKDRNYDPIRFRKP